MSRNLCRAVVLVWMAAASHLTIGQDAATTTDDPTAEIEAASQAYVAAYNARDVDKLVSLWAPEAVYISRTSGEQITGRDAMTAEFKGIFADDHAPKLAAETESIEFISPNVALERGTATVSDADGVVETDYRVVYVKQGGKWLIDRVTEDEIESAPSNYEHLKPLEWMIGKWIDASEEVTVELDCKWTENQNFISRTYSISSDQGAESSGLQIIGWDPKQEQIRSWLFDSSGVYIEGSWSHHDDRWVVQSVATLPDGGTGSFTSIFRPTDDGNYIWQKINQVIDGQILPNLDEIVVQRQ